jgi:PAS domain S-box-containing protein
VKAHKQPLDQHAAKKDACPSDRTRRTAQRNEAQFRGLYQHAPFGVALVDGGGRCLVANSGLQRILGYDEDELCHLTFTEFTHPGDRATTENLFRELSIGACDSNSLDQRYVRKDGRLVWGRLGVFVWQGDFGVPRIVCTLHDVTDYHEADERLRRSEEHYRRIVETSLEAIYQVNAAHRFVFTNQMAADITGYSLEELDGMPTALLRVAEEQEEIAERAAALRAGTLRKMQYERRIRRKDGSIRWVQMSLVPLTDDQGHYAGEFGMAADIHQRKLAELALRESEERYRRIVESAHEGIWQTDATRRTTFVNARMAEMLGFRQEEMLGHFMWAFTPERYRQGSQEPQLEDIGPRQAAEIQFQRKDGSTLWAREQTFPLLDEHGMRAGAVAMLVDITAQREFDATRLRLAAIVDSSPDAILCASMAGRVQDWNEGAVQLFGYSAEEAIGQPVAMLEPNSRADEVVGILQRVLKGRRIAQVETTRRHKDGHDIAVLLTVSPIRGAGGAIVGAAAIVHDISNRKRAEDALREVARERAEQAVVAGALSEASSALATALEPARLHEIILQQMARVVPYTSAHIFVYQDGWAVAAGGYGEPLLPVGIHLARLDEAKGLFPQTDDQARLMAETCIAPGWRQLPPWVGEHEVRSAIIVPLVVHGEAYGCLGIGSRTPNAYSARHLDVARAFAERIGQALWNARLYQLERERAGAAEHLASLRSDFVATVSHELRTPLSAVLGYAELLEGHWSRFDDAQRYLNVRRIVLAANRQKRLIDDLLHVSTIEAERLSVKHEQVRIAEVIERAVSVVNASYANQPFKVSGPVDLAALADASYVEQVLANLLDNAAKYSDEGSPIEVAWAREKNLVVVRVRDYGPGIAEQGRDMLFSRFGRMPGSRMRAGRVGTGLGLYLGREHAMAMGGTLDIESTGEGGSTFCLRLPIYEPGAIELAGVMNFERE